MHPTHRRASLTLVLAAILAGVADAAAQGIITSRRPNRVDTQDVRRAFDPKIVFKDLEYRMIGPTRGGRVTAVAGHAAQPSVFYMGATGGGVWKTENYGQSWRNISDGFFATGSIGAIRAAPSDPNVMYVGTGSDGLRSNVIVGKGVYRSSDAGKTWTHVGLEKTGQIGAVEVHPTNPDIAYVAAIGNPFGRSKDRGVYRTADGGRSWKKVLFVSDSVGVTDLEIHPTNPNVLYAGTWRAERKPWTIISGADLRAGVGIYKSIDGGDEWRRVTVGLPTGLVGKTDLAVSPADPRRVYALVEAPDSIEGLYRSDDEGETWRLMSNEGGLMRRPFYYTNVDADPTDADIVWVSNERFFRSGDGGKTWQSRPTPHGDNHDLWINPQDPRIMVQSNDGGANVTLDGGRTWSTQLNQPTAELYQVNLDDRFPYWAYAGQQDNSTIGVPSLPPTQSAPDHPAAWWVQIGGCETGPAVPKPGDWRTVYSNCKGRFGRYSHVLGQEQQYYVGAQNIYGHDPDDLKYRFQRVSPIAVSPHDPNVVYHGSQYLHRTRDGGGTWETISPDLTARDPRYQVISGEPITRDVTGEEFFSTTYAVEESALQRGVIWVGSNDGVVSVTQDDGRTWANVTPKGLPPHARIQTVEASPHDPAEAYVAALRYQVDDWRPYIFRTTDYGKTWTRLTNGKNGIPEDHPTRVVREDPRRSGLLYAGTEFGMWVSLDEGGSWLPFQQNLPVTPVTDIALRDNDLVLSTMGRSFWVLDDVTPLHQLQLQLAAMTRAQLFRPDSAYRLRYDASRGEEFGASGRDPSAAEYPPSGAILYYFLGGEETFGELKLDIADEQGNVIRSFTSDAPAPAGTPGQPATPEEQMRGAALLALGTLPLTKAQGLNRFIWDLAFPGAWSPESRRSGRGGPLVPPGQYLVQLSLGDWSQTFPLEVRIDPRAAADGVKPEDLVAQAELALRVRDLLAEVRALGARVGEARKEPVTAADSADVQSRLDALETRLLTARTGSYPQPMLIDQVQYLYSMLNTADQRPGRDAYQRYEELKAAVEEVRRELSSDRATLR